MQDNNSEFLKKQTLVFVTSNDKKVQEFERIIKKAGSIYRVTKTGDEKLDEPSNPKSLEELVRKKTIAAFKKHKMPIVVEHTLLDIAHLHGMPGYVTDYVTSKMTNYCMCDLLKSTDNRHAVAKTVIGYCDGKKVHVFEGVVKGTISNMPRGERGFGWDAIFIPDDADAGGKTFGQMEDSEKDRFSMRKIAVDKLITHLIANPLDYYNASNDNLESLIKVLGKKELVLFLGAGVPRNVGYASWWELLYTMTDALNYDKEIAETLTEDPLEMAEFCMQKDKANLLSKFIGELEPKTTLTQKLYNSPVYRSLIDLNPIKIYTTNYDTSLEKAYDIFKAEKPRVIKLHGDFANIKDLDKMPLVEIEKIFNEKYVLTETSYFRAFDDIQIMTNDYEELLKDLIAPEKLVLFVGYGMGDFNIKYMLYKANQEMGKAQFENIYFFTTKAEVVQESIMVSRGVRMVYGDDPSPKTALENFLYYLIKHKFDNRNNIEVQVSDSKNIPIEKVPQNSPIRNFFRKLCPIKK